MAELGAASGTAAAAAFHSQKAGDGQTYFMSLGQLQSLLNADEAEKVADGEGCPRRGPAVVLSLHAPARPLQVCGRPSTRFKGRWRKLSRRA